MSSGPRINAASIKTRMIAGFDTSTRRNSGKGFGMFRTIASSNSNNQKMKFVTSRSEFDSHAYIFVAGANCRILSKTM